MRRAAALALLLAGCKALLGDPDRIIALEILGPVTDTVVAGDTVHLRARALSANGDPDLDAVIQWFVLDTGTVRITLDAATGVAVPESVGTWQLQASVDDIRSDPIKLVVRPGPAAALRLEGLPASLVGGTAATLTVTAIDPFGNTASGYAGTVHFASTDTAATLPPDFAFTTGAAGVHAFSSGVTLRTPGPQTVSATDLADGSIAGSHPAVTVTAPPPP